MTDNTHTRLVLKDKPIIIVELEHRDPMTYNGWQSIVQPITDADTVEEGVQRAYHMWLDEYPELMITTVIEITK